MLCNIINTVFVVAFIQFVAVISNKSKSYNDYFDIYIQNGSYHGDLFPQKYLSIDNSQPSMSDISYYVKALKRVVDYFAEELNLTNPNIALSVYLTKGILKRTLIDYNHIITDEDRRIIKYIVNTAEDISSHYVYHFYKIDPDNLESKFSRLFKEDDSLVHSIGNFKKNVISKWIHSSVKLNDYIEQMDNMSLPREKYVELVISMDTFLASHSDFCITSIPSEPLPLKIKDKLRPCQLHTYCTDKVFKMPFVAYSLSHKFLYILIMAQTRRCYTISEEADNKHMDILCANMYRETVYLARRGYFFRDLFLEHIALCSILGYEEFHRRNWFQKSASWVDEDGCVDEDRNFIINRSRLYIAKATSSPQRKLIRENKHVQLYNDCHMHQMALTLIVLSHGIRHAAHYGNATL